MFTSGGGDKLVQAFARHRLAACGPALPVGMEAMREAVARLIDPKAWDDHDGYFAIRGYYPAWDQTGGTLTKADAILAALRGPAEQGWQNEGPQPLPGKTCTGCRHLTTEDWKDYLDNDETERGTYARCGARGGETITCYWSPNSSPPKWCPFTAPTTPEAPHV